jgi:predicted membrane chloride channel (bestrophin family)
MEKYLSIIKPRTFIAIVITWLTTFLSLKYKFQYNFDLTMISIAIIFPLVFTIRSAFKRREKALEFLSRFKAGIITVKSSVESNTNITVEEKHEILEALLRIPKSLIAYLGPDPLPMEALRADVSKVNDLLIERNEKLKVNGLLKILGFMRDVHLGIENTASIKTHRTPTSIRAYCLIFIYIYPIIYMPSIFYKLNESSSMNDSWILYALSIVSTFILISLFNVQEQLENPFDQDGIDDIKLETFNLDSH